MLHLEISNKHKAGEIECATKSLNLSSFSWQIVNYKKDLKLAVPKSLWYSLSTSNTFGSLCKLYNKPTWNKRINISNWQSFEGEVKSKLVRWILFTLRQRLTCKNPFRELWCFVVKEWLRRGANSYLGDFLRKKSYIQGNEQNLEGKGSSTTIDTPIYPLRKTMSFMPSGQWKTWSTMLKKIYSV